MGHERIKELARPCIVATMTGVDGIPQLIDATLISTDGDRLVLTGFERIQNHYGALVDYAQTWLLLARPSE